MTSPNLDMLEFINSKVLKHSKLQFNKVFQFFLKIMIKSLLSSIEKLNNPEYSLICYDIVFNIFWTLLNYTRNIKLTMFLCDRSIDLFNEYMDMIVSALNNNILSENKLNIKTTDIKLFIYNKTIGSLVFNKKNLSKALFKKKFKITKDACVLMQIYIKSVFVNYYKFERLYDNSDFDNEKPTIENILNNVYDRFSILIYSLFSNGYGNVLESIVYNEISTINNSNDKIIPMSINQIHLKIYVLTQLIKKIKTKIDINLLHSFNIKTNIQMDNVFYKKKQFESKKEFKQIIKLLAKP